MTEEPVELQRPQVLSSCSSGRRRAGDSSSPEFEFWMVRNPSFPQPNLLSADELFSDGVLLPLHLLQPYSSSDDPNPSPTTPAGEPGPEAETERESSEDDRNGCEPGSTPGPSSVLPVLSAPVAPTITSKRWKDIIFKKTDRRNSRDDNSLTVKEKDKERRKDKKGTGVGAGGNNPLSAAELNINIWPFSRSRSAGNGGSRPRMAAAGATRKVSSAPCSRSNSAGESKSRKWPSSPSRGGVHLGRSSPVWQVRRAGGLNGKGVDVAVKNAEKPVKKEGNECRRKTTAAVSSGGGAKPKVLQLNVPMCIGYRHHLSCRSDENSAVNVAAAAGSSGDGGGTQRSGNSSDEGIRGSSNLFNFRNLFTKKVH